MRNVIEDVLDFWFEESTPEQWFQKNDAFDEEIRARFGKDYDLAVNGVYDGWRETARGCLALLIILDQFSRNMFRGDKKMFATDGKALDIARHAVDNGFDNGLTTDRKAFLYLPFEHSENMADQKKSVELFSSLKNDNAGYYDFAVRHYDVIKKFGRFPHRNAILGRQSTTEEEEYLSAPDSGF